MITPNSAKSEAGLATNLWVKGVSYPVTILWVTDSHAEIIVPEDLALSSHQMAAVILHDFISLPMRVVAQTGQNVVLYFVQKPHASVLELIDQDLIKAGIDRLRDMLEERALPTGAFSVVEQWQDQAEREDRQIAATFSQRGADLESCLDKERTGLIAA